MKKIDSHQHFWKYNPIKDTWMSEDMEVIRRDFLPAELGVLLQENHIDGCITVQVDQNEDETNFLLSLANENEFIKGVVGWVDLTAENLDSRLDHFAQFKKLKGFRHVVQWEPDDEYLLREDFCKGIAKLAKYNFTYDILIFPKHLPAAIEFVKKFPNQKFVIDHLAKPNFKLSDFSEWEKGIREIAAFPNVYCKVSGLVTEADWNNWIETDFTYCLNVVTEAFGVNRLMFGSDWPVALLATTYKGLCDIVTHYFSKFSEEDQDKIWGKNAIDFYNL